MCLHAVSEIWYENIIIGIRRIRILKLEFTYKKNKKNKKNRIERLPTGVAKYLYTVERRTWTILDYKRVNECGCDGLKTQIWPITDDRRRSRVQRF